MSAIVDLLCAVLFWAVLRGRVGAEVNFEEDPQADELSFAADTLELTISIWIIASWVCTQTAKASRKCQSQKKAATVPPPTRNLADAEPAAACRNVTESKLPCPTQVEWKRPAAPRRTPEKIAIVDTVRAGRFDELAGKLHEACEKIWRADRGSPGESVEEKCSELVEAALLGCLSRRRSVLALDVLDHVKDFVGSGSCRLWSVVLYAAAESGRTELGTSCFERLQAFQMPGPYDYVNLVRCYAQQQDRAGMRALIRKLRDSGVQLDSATASKAFAACAAQKAFDLAEMIVYSGVSSEGPEVKAWNTLMAFYLQHRRPADCFYLRDLMEVQNVDPNAKTFSLLVEAGARCKDRIEVREAIKKLNVPDKSFSSLNCTNVIRSLTEASMAREADEVLCLLQAFGAKPHVACYETVFRCYFEAGLVWEAMTLLDHARKENIVITHQRR